MGIMNIKFFTPLFHKFGGRKAKKKESGNGIVDQLKAGFGEILGFD